MSDLPVNDLPPRCERVQDLASSWLDGQLDAERRAAIDGHLARCDLCHGFYADLRELGRLVRGIEEDALPADFAARVREAATVATRRRSWLHDPMFTRVAAAIMVVLAVAVAYRLGHDHGTRDGAIDSVRGVGASEVSPIGFDQGLRAARSLVGDVGTLDKVAPRLRRPLLRAQLEHFQLPEWARRVRSDHRIDGEVEALARFVERVERMVAEDMGPLADIQRQIERQGFNLEGLADGVSVDVGLDPRHRRAQRIQVVRHVASDLPGDVQSLLDRVLLMKDALVFGVATPETMQVVMPDVFRGGHPLEIEMGGPGRRTDALREQLEAMFGGSRGSGEIVVEEESGNGSYSYRVIIRSGSNRPRNRSGR